MNIVVLCGRALSLLWSIPTRMKISLGIIWLKIIFYVCTGLLRTLHDFFLRITHNRQKYHFSFQIFTYIYLKKCYFYKKLKKD